MNPLQTPFLANDHRADLRRDAAAISAGRAYRALGPSGTRRTIGFAILASGGWLRMLRSAGGTLRALGAHRA